MVVSELLVDCGVVWVCGVVSAFDRVAELLKKSADDAPIGSAAVEIL